MIRNMSGANTALFWSVKSLWSGMERSGMEDDNLSAEVRIKISDSNEAELAERKEND